MKYGIEVEGQLIGLKTLFLTGREFTDAKFDFVEYCKEHGFEQVYISDHEAIVSIGLSDKDSDRLVELSQNVKVTIERTQLSGKDTDRIPGVSIMLAVFTPVDMGLLVKGDQIKISKGLNVWAVPVENMITTVPSDFLGDVELTNPDDASA